MVETRLGVLVDFTNYLPPNVLFFIVNPIYFVLQCGYLIFSIHIQAKHIQIKYMLIQTKQVSIIFFCHKKRFQS